MMRTDSEPPLAPIAIVGMRLRVPGASDVDQFWQNLADGVESITTLTAEDMRSAGVPDDVLALPGYVNAAPLLGDIDRFDAGFFGFSARDAALTDPQHRIFLETAWEALEDAGYDPATFGGAIGVFGGCEMSTYLYQLFQNPDALGYVDGMQLMVTNDKDHLCTQVSYRLDLRGPSVVVQTTCSTSLVATSVACESLRSGRSDMALAGGVTVRVPQRGGYYYVAGSILSPDGHCRPFDMNAQGTVVGSGVGLVVLKRLEDALADGDTIHAVIRGFGLNNDGRDKVGYTAPGVSGQATAISDAYRCAGVSPESVGYVEAHGTGTILGDPIELSALTEVFRQYTDRRGFCGIGSAKSNFGHLSCASGVVGLIKSVLCLEHAAIPPTVHYRAPNPGIDFVASPFYVTQSLHPFARNGTPRRAAVSSFGVGGTNAHMLLEEAPARDAPTDRRPHQILTVSARSSDAQREAATRLATYLTRHPERDLADVAFTLHVGRRGFPHRRSHVVAADDRAGAVAALLEQSADGGTSCAAGQSDVVFMFPGQGSQYPGMAAQLYAAEPLVKRTIDECCRKLKPDLGLDLRRVLFPSRRRRGSAAAELRDTALAQPALFVIGYALACLWQSWGVRPAAMIGHSVGEYVAATVAGVFELDDALSLIAQRGRLISELPRGSMLAVMARADDVAEYVDGELSLAAVNAPELCVLSGPDEAVARVEKLLARSDLVTHRLHTSHAFHSSMMEPMLDGFEKLVDQVPMSPPTIPYVATLTGQWADAEVTEPSYWSAQIRSTVRFAEGLRTLVAPGGPVSADPLLLEVGPGRALISSAMGGGVAPSARLLQSMGGAEDDTPETELLSRSLGRLWEHGVEIDWHAFHSTEPRRRVSLPTYPFERESYWIGRPNAAASADSTGPRDISGWFSLPVWKEAPVDREESPDLTGQAVLVFDEETGVGARIGAELLALGALPVTVRRGERFERVTDREYVLNPHDETSIGDLVAEVCRGHTLSGVIHCWGAEPPGDSDVRDAALCTFLTPLRTAVALGAQTTARPLPVLLIARGSTAVGEDDDLDPARAFGIGAAKVLPQELTGLSLCQIDVDDDVAVAAQVVAEMAAGATESELACRAGARFVRAYDPVAIDTVRPVASLPPDPVVLVTGGLGYMGLLLAEAAFDGLGAKLVLLGRSHLPPPAQWAAASGDGTLGEAQRTLLRRLAVLQAQRDDILVVQTDLADSDQVHEAVNAAFARFGRVDMVVHGAANVSPAAFGLVGDTDADVVEAQITPKVEGLLHLIDAMRGREPLHWVIHGSISATLGGLGLAAYAGANAVLNVIVERGARSGQDWLSIEWDAWDNAGEAQAHALKAAPIRPPEGQDAFLRLVGAAAGSRVVVAAQDLEDRLDSWVRFATTDRPADSASHPRPDLSTAFLAPRTDTERALTAIWCAQLGIDEVGVHDRFFDLGGHSLLAIQVAAEIRNRFDVALPVVQLFKAPTVAELALYVENPDVSVSAASVSPASSSIDVGDSAGTDDAEGPGKAAKDSYRRFYDDITRRLAVTGMGEASYFLNYGYVSLGAEDEAVRAVPEGAFNANSVRLAYELVGATPLAGRDVLDVGCGRGGTAALWADEYEGNVTGIDLSPEAVAFCAQTHVRPNLTFKVGDAEHLPLEDAAADVVTNIESSHTYPDMRAFLAEVRRVLRSGGWFLHTDLLPTQRWLEVRAILTVSGFTVEVDREITANVLASCDEVAAGRTKAFGEADSMIDNFLAVPGSTVYEQMRTGTWEYRILRSRLK
ncbi:MAG: polyketide synthase [Mycobacterium sp.]|nr:polyketide synthase [Mycobacterium sp.]